MERWQLSELVDYQEGSIVSRTLIKKSTGSVTVFAFDRGEGLSEHTAPYDALVHVIEGAVEIEVAGKAVQVEENELVILPANEPHALSAVERFKMVLTMIKS